MGYPTLVDSVADYKLVTSITAATISADADGTAVPLEGYNSATFVYAPGTVAAGTVPAPEESLDNSTWTAIAVADLISVDGNEVVLADLVSDTDTRFGYRGGAAFIRAGIAVSGAGGPLFTGVLIGNPNHGAIDGNSNPIIT